MSAAKRHKAYAHDIYPSRAGSYPRLIERSDPVVYGSAADGPLDEQQLASYEKRGYITYPRFFNSQDVSSYRAELDALRKSDTVRRRPWAITEPGSNEIRSVFGIHPRQGLLARLCIDPRITAIARQILGGDVYIHQSRVNYKPGFRGKEFYWHSDFETWHVEDGLPRMRSLSCFISLSDNTPHNGPLMVIPGSHKQFLVCEGTTPAEHYKRSLKTQELGVPDDANLARMVEVNGLETPIGPAGSVTFFDCNIMHGSNSNITPMPRSNVFIVFNSVENRPEKPYCGLAPRPEFVANRTDFTPV